MARIRTIKPEFWKHEGLSELPEATHILAAALLNYADDYGYFNANPKLVQAECSPLRDPSVKTPESLRSLQAVGYIRLGTGEDGKRYGHIVEFDRHQKVSHPATSKISAKTIVWDDSGNPPEKHQNIPESLRPEQGTGNREQGIERGTGNGEVAPAALTAITPTPDLEPSEPIGKLSASIRTPCASAEKVEMPAALIREPALLAYNVVALDCGWPEAQRITPKRAAAIKKRLAECGGMEGWEAAMAKARASPFLRGETGRSRGHENWRPDIDFFLRSEVFTKLMEGGFDGRTNGYGQAEVSGFAAVIAGARDAARAAGAQPGSVDVESG